jgi:hypothetical protein
MYLFGGYKNHYGDKIEMDVLGGDKGTHGRD